MQVIFSLKFLVSLVYFCCIIMVGNLLYIFSAIQFMMLNFGFCDNEFTLELFKILDFFSNSQLGVRMLMSELSPNVHPSGHSFSILAFSQQTLIKSDVVMSANCKHQTTSASTSLGGMKSQQVPKPYVAHGPYQPCIVSLNPLCFTLVPVTRGQGQRTQSLAILKQR